MNKTGKYKRWNETEISLLKKLYPRKRVRNLAKHFPKRNKATIVAKALQLKLPSAKLWQPEENKILKLHFSESSKKELLKLLPKRTWPAILAQGERLGLKRTTNKPKINVNERYFLKWSANMAYILGFILADGSIVKGTYKGYSDTLKFGVQISDVDILKKIKSELYSRHKISIVENAAYLSISSQKIVDSLKKLGISYHKSLKESVPRIPERFIKDFIRGIVDGDGYISYDKRNYPTIGVAGGENTLKFISQHFKRDFGLHSSLSKSTWSKQVNEFLYVIAYRASSAKTIILYLYENAEIYLDRKYYLAQKCKNVSFRPKRKGPK